MARKSSKRKKSPETTVQKAETVGNDFTVIPRGTVEKGQPRVITSTRFVQDSAESALKMPAALSTYECMTRDDAVATSIASTNVSVVPSIAKGIVEAGISKSRESQDAAEFINYNLHNMSYGTWLDSALNMATDLQNGFSLQNIVFERRSYGQYAGKYCLKKLSPRSQKSVYGWVWDRNFREVQGVLQKPMTKKIGKERETFYEYGITTSSGVVKDPTLTYIKSPNLLHFTYDSVDGNPEGKSPLFSCYDSYIEKQLVQRYQIVGVTKDFGGVAVIRVPSELLRRAAEPDIYPQEAEELIALEAEAAAFHAGESSYITMSSETQDDGNVPLYDFKLQGVEGGGANYDSSAIIDQKRKAIYNVFGASHVILGQDGGGSYSLSSTKVSIHELFIQKAIDFKVNVINTQLIPRLLRANNIHLDWKDMPRFVAADPTELSLDELGKFLQRTKSVNALTKEQHEQTLKRAGLTAEGLDEIDYSDKGDSRSGESEGSSGTGDTQFGGSSSDTNSENGGVEKALFYKDDENRIISCQTGKPVGTLTD